MFIFFFIVSPILFVIAAVLLVPLYFAPPKSMEKTKRLKTIAWSLWTAAAFGVVYLAGETEYGSRETSHVAHDFDFWFDYTLDVATTSVAFYLPAGIYWARILIAKGRG